MNISIRPLRDKDHPFVLACVAEIGISSGFNWPEEALSPELAWAQGWAAWEGSQLAAFVLWRSGVDRNEITCLATAPVFRRRGHMRALLRTLMTEVNDAPWLLEVHLSNFAAQSMYQSIGFARVGVRRNYYKDGSDALVYRHASVG